MKKIGYVLIFAGLIGICGNAHARGHGGSHGHYSGGGGGYSGHHYGHRRPGGGTYYGGHGSWYRGQHYARPARGRVGIGFYFGAPYGYRYYPYYRYYGYPYYPYYPYYSYPPPVVTVPSQPPVYIERSPQPSTSGKSEGYWYYCSDPAGYYPYVNECNGEWQPVSARPPGK